MNIKLVIHRRLPGQTKQRYKRRMKLGLQILTRSVLGIVIMAALIFFSAGSLDYWQGWVFFGINAAILTLTAWILWDNPELIEERLRPGGKMRSWDRTYYFLSTPLYFGAIILAAVDAGRGNWSAPIPTLVYASSLILFVLAHTLFLWAKKANSFFSSVGRIQMERGHTVCDDGPYRLIRHPGYLSGIAFGLMTPLLLGSLWALIPQSLAAVLVVVRTYCEDKMLLEELPGYEEYARRTRYRLIPGLW
jgi:protein-S-isoprenylcysteine O-methyltransferase Ste14